MKIFILLKKKTCWQTAGRDNSKNWSAVGFYFADMLSKKLGVTVGIIGCNWGGSSASANDYSEDKCFSKTLT